MTTRLLFWIVLCGMCLAGRLAQAQTAYSGPPGAELMQKAKKLQASGDRSGAAAAYQHLRRLHQRR